MKNYFNIDAITKEDLARERKMNAWAALYMMYDDNEAHMLQAFHNNHMGSSDTEKIHESCIQIAQALIEMRYDGASDETEPEEIRAYFEEAKKTA